MYDEKENLYVCTLKIGNQLVLRREIIMQRRREILKIVAWDLHAEREKYLCYEGS